MDLDTMGSWPALERTLRVVVAVMLASGLGCRRDAPHGREADDVPEVERVEPTRSSERGEPIVGVLGCDARFADGTCWRVRARPLVLWLPGEWDASSLDVRLDARPLARHFTGQPTSGREPGWQAHASEQGLLIRVPELPSRGDLTVLDEHGELARVRLGPMPSAYVDARGIDDFDLDGEAARAMRARGGERLALLLDCLRLNRHADLRQVVEELPRLAERAERVGEQREIARLHIAVASKLIHESAFDEAARAVEQARRWTARSPDLAINADQLDATIARRIGLTEMSLDSLDRADAWAAALRLGDDPHYDTTLATLSVDRAIALAAMGRLDEAEQLCARALVELGEGRGATAQGIRNNVAWIRLLRREDDPQAPSAVSEYRSLVEVDPRATTWLNLAIASSRDGDLELAERMLAKLDPEQLSDRDRVWFELARARVVRAKGRRYWAKARAHLDRAALAAERGSELEPVLRVRLERAGLELDAGDRVAARREFEAAERVADRLALSIDGESGRSLLRSTRSHARARHVELLLALDDPDAALCTVLGGRARHLRSLAVTTDIRDDAALANHRAIWSDYHRRKQAMLDREAAAWQLSGADHERELAALAREAEALDELLRAARGPLERASAPWHCEAVRARARGEALLTMTADAQGRGWHFFGDREGQVEHVHLEAHEGEALDEVAGRALSQLDVTLEDVERLTVIPTGPFGALDFQLLAPASMRVVHGLGLGPAPSTDTPWQARASVVAGEGGLAHVEREAAFVRSALERGGWQIEAWRPGTPDQPALLHFAGHGERAGTAGWRSALRLQGGEELTSSELIASRQAPRQVVLGACMAGMTSPELIDGGMNMAVAFLLAGAELVIAPDGEVDDALSEAFARALYRDAPSGAAGASLRDAWLDRMLEAKRSDPRMIGWRVWVR